MDNSTGPFTKKEIELIKHYFSGDSGILDEIAKTFLQVSPRPNLQDGMLEIIRKNFLPVLNADIDFDNQWDFYFNLPQIQGLNPAIATLHIQAKDLEKKYLEETLARLNGEEVVDGIVLEDLKKKSEKNDEERFITMLAFVNLVNYVQQRIRYLKSVANAKEETEEEKVKREKADNNE